MREIFYLTKRNCLIYLRDRSAVYFSMLSMLIILALMVMFLGKTNSEDLVNILARYGGERDTELDERNAAYLVQLWTMAGILLVNAVTVTMTVTGNMVEDETRKRIMAFYVTPIKRFKLTLGYVLAAWSVGFGMCLFTLAAGEGYFLLQGHELLSGGNLLALCGMLALNTFVFAIIGYVLALFVHSRSAWGGILTIIGTLVGFAGGIYLPMTALSEKVQAVLKCLPVIHGAAMMRKVCTDEAIEATFAGLPEVAGDVFRERMGICLSFGDHVISVEEQVIFLLLYAIIALSIAVVLNRKRKYK